MPAPLELDPVAALRIAMVMLAVAAAILSAWCWAIVRLALGHPLLPRVPRRIVPWGVLSVVASIVLYFGFQMVAVIGYLLSRRFGGAGAGGKALSHSDQLLLSAVSNLATAQTLPLLLWLTCRAGLSDLGLVGRDFVKNVTKGLVALALVLPLVYLVSFLTMVIWKRTPHPVELSILKGGDPWTLAIAAITAVVAAPLTEEMVFRGVLLGWLWKVGVQPAESEVFAPDAIEGVAVSPAGPEEILFLPTVDESERPAKAPLPDGPAWMANIITSAIFAGLHYGQWPAPVPLFVLSLALGELYRRTGSLVAPIALHASFNGLSTFFMILAAK